jgi:F0F1-type ATP synthase assembly protein I
VRPDPSRPDRPLLWLSKYLALALTLPASVAAGYILGWAADLWLHIPVLRAVGILLGMIAGITQIVKQLNRETEPSNTPAGRRR